MKIYFDDFGPETRNEITVRLMDQIILEENRKKPETNQEWTEIWEKACDRINRNNFAIDINY